MTLEEYLDSSADDLEKMTDAELLEFCKPFLEVSRPELAPKPIKHTPISNMKPSSYVSPEDIARRAKIAKGREIARQFGLEL